MTADQLRECREAFEKWDRQDNGVVSRLKIWQAACEWMNTRPTAVASHAEGEVAAWRLRIGDSDQWSFCSTESDADFYGKQSGMTYEKERLYTHPRATSAEVERDAARYRWLRDLPRNYDGRKNGFHVTLAKAKDKPREWFIETMRGLDLDQAIDAAMAARGDDK